MTALVKSQKNIILALGAILLIYAILPMVLSDNIPSDMTENLYWGKELQWGYYKHPFLFGWISYGFYWLCGKVPESQYVLTQLNMAVALYFIYKIGLHFLKSKDKALLGVLIYAATLIISVGDKKFNANTILISLLPMCFYFFAKFADKATLGNSVALGASAALAFVGKYFAALPILVMVAAYFARRENWRMFKTPYPYVVLAGFFAVASPHLIWLVRNDFISFQYAFEKAASAESALWGRVKYPLSYLATQLAFMLPAFVLLWRNRLSLKPQFDVKKYDGFLVESVFLLPLAAPFVLSILLNMRIGTFWSVPLYFLFGTYILMKNDVKIDMKKALAYVLTLNMVVALAAAISGVAMRRYALRHTDKAIVSFFNARETAAHITGVWREKFGMDKPIKYIVADHMTDSLSAYLPDNPSLYKSESESPTIKFADMMWHCYLKTALVGSEKTKPDSSAVFSEVYRTKNGHYINIEFICGGDK